MPKVIHTVSQTLRRSSLAMQLSAGGEFANPTITLRSGRTVGLRASAPTYEKPAFTANLD